MQIESKIVNDIENKKEIMPRLMTSYDGDLVMLALDFGGSENSGFSGVVLYSSKPHFKIGEIRDCLGFKNFDGSIMLKNVE